MGETPPLVEQSFESLSDAIIYVFQQEQTSLLSLDRICEALRAPNLFINWKKEGLVPCSTIFRRRISSTLSSCELFVRAGPPRTGMWAIRPNNPLFLSDGAISASIEQMLTDNGPMTLQDFVTTSQLNGADVNLFERFLTEHSTEFTCGPDETYWFTGQPRPIQMDFESISYALAYALSLFPDGASVEELNWFLCLATVGGSKRITRRCVSRELSRRADLFANISRARYILIPKPPSDSFTRMEPVAPQPPPPDRAIPLVEPIFQLPPPPLTGTGTGPDLPGRPTDEEEWDPFNFFNRDFQFAPD
jgi:hypothetical protein